MSKLPVSKLRPPSVQSMANSRLPVPAGTTSVHSQLTQRASGETEIKTNLQGPGVKIVRSALSSKTSSGRVVQTTKTTITKAPVPTRGATATTRPTTSAMRPSTSVNPPRPVTQGAPAARLAAPTRGPARRCPPRGPDTLKPPPAAGLRPPTATTGKVPVTKFEIKQRAVTLASAEEQKKQKVESLDETFHRHASLAATLLHMLVDEPAHLDMGKMWMDRLRMYNDTRPKQVTRNAYIYLMLAQLQMGHLYSPFTLAPPKGALPPVDRYKSDKYQNELLEILPITLTTPNINNSLTGTLEEYMRTIRPSQLVSSLPQPKHGLIVHAACFSNPAGGVNNYGEPAS